MYLLRRAATRAMQLQSTSASAILRVRPISNTHRIPPLLSSKQWTVPPVQRRFASGEPETSPDQLTTEAQSLSESQQARAAIGSAEIQTSPAEETSNVESAAIEATVAAGTAPTNVSFVSTVAAETASRIPPNNVLYVGNLYFEVSEDALQQKFAPYGNIARVRIVYDQRGLSKGFGYVEFEKLEDATAAVEGLSQQVFRGRRMAVQYHRKRTSDLSTPRKPNDPSKTLFIGNMSFEMSDKDLNDLFREVRNVVDVRVAIDRRTGQPRGFAHADFLDMDSALKAKEHLQSKEVYGRRLRVDFSRSAPRTPSE